MHWYITIEESIIISIGHTSIYGPINSYDILLVIGYSSGYCGPSFSLIISNLENVYSCKYKFELLNPISF